ncbi:MAG TPA: DUF1616 domain-containing protein [Methanocellaceae archaeon]
MSEEKPINQSEKRKNKSRLILNLFLTFVFIAILLTCIYFTAYLIVNPQNVDKFTEFYLLGYGGKADNYPTGLDQGDLVSVTVGVANHEDRDMDYDLVVMLDDGTRQSRQYEQEISLADNGTWQKPITMRPMLVGTQVKLDFLLYADGDMTSPYRECYLYLNESRPGYVNNLKRQNKNLDPVQE